MFAASSVLVMAAGFTVPGVGGPQAAGAEPTTVSGRVLRSNGAAASATAVRIYVRPAGGGRVVLVGNTRTDRQGRYIASLSAETIGRYAAPGGLVDLVTIPDGTGDEVGIPQYSSALLASDGTLRQSTDSGSPLVVDASLAGDGTSSQRGASYTTAVAASSARCYTGLVYWNTTPLPDTPAAIGSHQIAKGASNWTSTIEYRNTRTTSFQTGYAVTAGTVGAGALSFSANGSVTRDSTMSVTALTEVPGSTNTITNRKQVITIGQSMDHYRCWQSPTTPPANPAYWPQYSVVVVPGVWKRDFYTQNFDGNATVTCTGPDSTIGPGLFSRTAGQSYTMRQSFSVGVSYNRASGTFTGNATVTTSRTSGTQVTQTFHNRASGNKHLCGEKSPNLGSATNVGIIVAKV